MNDVAELERFVVLHARAQQLPPEQYRAVLDRIGNDEDGKAGSWAVEWSRSAAELRERGDPLAACRHWTMARFPYVDGPARQKALDNAVAAFDAWRTGQDGLDRLRVDTPRGELHAWATGLSATPARPLLLIMGGIVSTKEQWAPALALVRRLGMAGVVAELPGVGQNTRPYDEDAWRMIPDILDGIGAAASGKAYMLALSFSGHLALRAAAEDDRLRGLVLAGAPVRDFFTDPDWQRGLPRITRDTLGHLTGTEPEAVAGRVRDWALTDAELASVRVPVACVVSARDEVIPRSDVDLLTRVLPRVRLLEHDDVHGSPDHVAESQLWSVLSVLRMRRAKPLRRAVMRAALFAMRRRSGAAR